MSHRTTAYLSQVLRQRVLWLLLLVPVLVGPAPGAVGGCGCGSDPLDEPVDLEAYCIEREQLVCVREFERGVGSVFDRDDCRREVIDLCSTRSFPRGCSPSKRKASACLNALHARSTLGETVNQLKECRDLCDFSTALQGDGGMP